MNLVQYFTVSMLIQKLKHRGPGYRVAVLVRLLAPWSEVWTRHLLIALDLHYMKLRLHTPTATPHNEQDTRLAVVP